MNRPQPLVLCSTRFAWLVVLLLLPGLSVADRFDDRLDFSLNLGTNKVSWVYNNSLRETQLRTISVGWSQAMSPSVRGRLNVRYLDTGQVTNPQLVGLNTAGDGLGIELEVTMLDTSSFDMGLRFSYDFAWTENVIDTQMIENKWTTIGLGLDAKLALSKRLTLLAGAASVSVEGEELLSGDVHQLTLFNEESSVAYFAGIGMQTDERGFIDVRVNRGYESGVMLSFRRLY